MTTTTIFGETSDGVLESTNSTFSTARSGSSLTANTGSSDADIKHQHFGSNYILDEAWLEWDTSDVEGDVITSVDLDLWIDGTIFTGGGAWECEAYDLTFGATLTTADWDHAGSATKIAGLATGSMTGGQYNTWTETGSGLSDFIANDAAGSTQMVLVHEDLPGNTAPGSSTLDQITIFTADQTGTTNDPKLTVEHTVVNTGAGTLTHDELDVTGTGVSEPPTVTGAGTLTHDELDVTGTASFDVRLGSGGVELQEVALSGQVPGTNVRTSALRDPQRRDAVRIEVLNSAGVVVGNLAPVVNSPTVTVDAHAAIKRTLSALSLDPTDAASLDPYGDRLRPVWTHGGTDYPLGVFVWGTAGYKRQPWGLELEGGTAYDLGFVLRQPMRRAFGLSTSQRLDQALTELVEAAGIVDHNIQQSSLKPSTPLAWPIGANRADAIKALADRLTYSTWFDNTGTFVAKQTPDPDVNAPQHWYDEDAVEAGVGESDDLWQRPNTWVVISTAAGADPIVGTYTLPSSHPASVTARGFEVPSVHPVPGITSTAVADQHARDIATQAVTAREVTLVTSPEPSHDINDIVSWRGTRYREVAWSLMLEPGAPHSHRLRRVDDAT